MTVPAPGSLPDVIECLANLSSDEVFTPPAVANAMLDLLPQEIFSNPATTILDPSVKSGIFLREAAKRFIKGEEAAIPDLKERVEHIMRHQLFGIALTELTALTARRTLYCSAYAAGKYSVCRFADDAGNIRYTSTEHTFKGGKCIYCGAAEAAWGAEKRGGKEAYAYEFIHCAPSVIAGEAKQSNGAPVIASEVPSVIARERSDRSNLAYNEIASQATHEGKIAMTDEAAYAGRNCNDDIKEDEMHFDVVAGNPPYQMSTGGGQAQATPLYDKFVEMAKRLNPRYITMIMPARWYAGGMGLEKFRGAMMSDRHIRRMVDYANAKDCFPQNSISGGVCYFLWDGEYNGDCTFTNINGNDKSTLTRPLNEFPVLVRYNEAVSIIHKVRGNDWKPFDTIVSSLMPYGLPSDYRGRNTKEHDDDLTLYASDGETYIRPQIITKGTDSIYRYKVMISKTGAEHAGEPDKDGAFRVLTSSLKVLKPSEVCSFSYFIIGSYDNEQEAENTLLYLKTRFVRFLILIAMTSINISKNVFPFVPLQDFSPSSPIDWTQSAAEVDKALYGKYGLTKEEREFIEGMVREM